MKLEFPLEFEEFFTGGLAELRKTIMVQMAAIDQSLDLEKNCISGSKHNTYKKLLTNK